MHGFHSTYEELKLFQKEMQKHLIFGFHSTYEELKLLRIHFNHNA